MNNDPTSAIYLTYKTRMLAEARNRFRANFANTLVAWYSLWLITFSILDLKAANGGGHGQLIVILSIFVFGLSLIIPAIGYDEKAVRHRECYLRLQRLRSQSMATGAKMQKYYDILEGYPNHSDIEWDAMLVRAANRKQTLSNSAGDIEITRLQYCRVYGESAASWIVYVLLLLVPLIAMHWAT